MSVRRLKPSRTLTDSHKTQIHVLSVLCRDGSPATPRHFEIREIAEALGNNDEKEVQRYLLILEGQKLVAPYPEGDFTSNRWCITQEGLRTAKTISKSLIQ
ncbi:MAG: hypothetical protein KDD53_03035 [Bdellovibrionales bacterium]|nr:hypothetical protein [Bdellovibrionales bacterium]